MVPDATKDKRFRNNPLVLGYPHIRFYAGTPLYAGDGVPVGTLCVIDTIARSLSPAQIKALTILSHQVQTHMELRLERNRLRAATSAVRDLTGKLENQQPTAERDR